MYHEYPTYLMQHGSKLSAASASGGSASFMVGRISYTFNLSGPCMSTDTACSSSLVATHLAREFLMEEKLRRAVVGGSNLVLSSVTMAALCQMQALSPAGRCRTFDADAEGYGRGDGVIVMIVSNNMIEAESDPISVLRSTAVNQDGRSSGLTAPNGPAQAKLILDALKRSTASPQDLRFVALHGTGTQLGDPIELNALSQATKSITTLTLASSKTCFSHTEGAAGLTGIVSAFQAGQHLVAAPFVNLRSVNPYIEFALSEWKTLSFNGLITVPRQPQGYASHRDWESLLASSSFGMSGVNAHAICGCPMSPTGSPHHPIYNLRFSRVQFWPKILENPLIRRFSRSLHSLMFKIDTKVPAASWISDCRIDGRTNSVFSIAIESFVAAVNLAVPETSGDIVLRNINKTNSLNEARLDRLILVCEMDLSTGFSELKHDTLTCVEANINRLSSESRPKLQVPKAKIRWHILNERRSRPFMKLADIAALPRWTEGGWMTAPPFAQFSVQLLMTKPTRRNGPSELYRFSSFIYLGNSARKSPKTIATVDSESLLIFSDDGRLSSSMAEVAVSTGAKSERCASNVADDDHSWQAEWKAMDLVPMTGLSMGLIAISTREFSLQQIIKVSAGVGNIGALNICYDETIRDFSRFSELKTSSAIHLDILMKYSCANVCAFISQPPPKRRKISEWEVVSLIDICKAAETFNTSIKLSILTFSSVNVPPFDYIYQPTALLLHGVARTLFMEVRSSHGVSIDLELESCPLPFDVLAALIRREGAYAVAVRSERLYSLRLMKSRLPRKRIYSHEFSGGNSALIVGGNRGLGLEYSQYLLKTGIKTLVTASRSRQEPPAFPQELTQRARIYSLLVDASDPDDIMRMHSYIREELPHIARLVFAAGLSGFARLKDITMLEFWGVAGVKVRKLVEI